ncbi:hypothetical protein BD311DRAFT_751006 [Dichomitus squalens]|uniref:Uncharacterized protein n=1 Tax=Dichomitus squalens TaxID=114155 RepID=A0A4Q9MXI0_9APHY|nr:hypothetical protein BD311DRAFT_751006 [Dichomitus squalens]
MKGTSSSIDIPIWLVRRPSRNTERALFGLRSRPPTARLRTLAAASGARPHCLVTVALRC